MTSQTPDKIEAELLPDDYNKYDYSFKMIVIGDAGVGKIVSHQRHQKAFLKKHTQLQ